jgi:hypothetical protein
LAVPRASGPVLIFCASGLIFGVTEGVRSQFQVLRSRTLFRRFRGRWGPFSCFALPYMFLAVRRAYALVFMFCAPELVFCGTEGVGSRFHVLRARTHFRWHRGRRVPFSCFALPFSFSAVPTASGPILMFCAPGLVFGGTEGIGFHFHILRSRNHCSSVRRASGSFSCFALPDSFSAVPKASGPFFMFCALGLIFNCTRGVGSRFHVLLSRTLFRLYRGRRIPFSCFALPNSF